MILLTMAVYEKLMRLLMDRYEGSFENFMLSILEANVKLEKNERGVDAEMATLVRKPALSKWKRARYIYNCQTLFCQWASQVKEMIIIVK